MLSTSSGLSKCNTVSALQPISPLLSFDAPPKYSFSISDKYGAERYSRNRQISRRMDTHGIIVVERFATFHYY